MGFKRMTSDKNGFARVGIPETSHVFFLEGPRCKWFFGGTLDAQGRADEPTKIGCETRPDSALFPRKITRRSTRNDGISQGGMTKGGRSILGPRLPVGQIAVAETALVDCAPKMAGSSIIVFSLLPVNRFSKLTRNFTESPHQGCFSTINTSNES